MDQQLEILQQRALGSKEGKEGKRWGHWKPVCFLRYFVSILSISFFSVIRCLVDFPCQIMFSMFLINSKDSERPT